jgi:hypothetical protein
VLSSVRRYTTMEVVFENVLLYGIVMSCLLADFFLTMLIIERYAKVLRKDASVLEMNKMVKPFWKRFGLRWGTTVYVSLLALLSPLAFYLLFQQKVVIYFMSGAYFIIFVGHLKHLADIEDMQDLRESIGNIKEV